MLSNLGRRWENGDFDFVLNKLLQFMTQTRFNNGAAQNFNGSLTTSTRLICCCLDVGDWRPWCSEIKALHRWAVSASLITRSCCKRTNANQGCMLPLFPESIRIEANAELMLFTLRPSKLCFWVNFTLIHSCKLVLSFDFYGTKYLRQAAGVRSRQAFLNLEFSVSCSATLLVEIS